MEDSLVNREMVEEELGREEFMVEIEKQGLPHFTMEMMPWYL